MTEDEMAGWHHGLNGHEFEWTPGNGDGQGGLACCDSWGRKESDTTERLNWSELNWWIISIVILLFFSYLHVDLISVHMNKLPLGIGGKFVIFYLRWLCSQVGYKFFFNLSEESPPSALFKTKTSCEIPKEKYSNEATLYGVTKGCLGAGLPVLTFSLLVLGSLKTSIGAWYVYFKLKYRKKPLKYYILTFNFNTLQGK